MNPRTLYVGIDVAKAKPSDAVVINEELHIVDKWDAPTPGDAAARMREIEPPVWVAIDAPRRGNLGFMRDPEFRCSLQTPPPEGKYQNCRVIEYELMRRGMAIYFAPGELKDWMAVGECLFDKLAREGYEEYRGSRLTAGRIMLEYYPYASFCVLHKGLPAKKRSPLGREQRITLVREYGITGDLAVLNEDQLDALAGAITAHALAKCTATWVGEPREGVLCVPGKLLAKYA